MVAKQWLAMTVLGLAFAAPSSALAAGEGKQDAYDATCDRHGSGPVVVPLRGEYWIHLGCEDQLRGIPPTPLEVMRALGDLPGSDSMQGKLRRVTVVIPMVLPASIGTGYGVQMRTWF